GSQVSPHRLTKNVSQSLVDGPSRGNRINGSPLRSAKSVRNTDGSSANKPHYTGPPSREAEPEKEPELPPIPPKIKDISPQRAKRQLDTVDGNGDQRIKRKSSKRSLSPQSALRKSKRHRNPIPRSSDYASR